MSNQTEEKTKICRLCHEACDNNFDAVNDTKIRMLETLQLTLEQPLREEELICNSCTENLKKCSDLKLLYQNTEDCIKSFSSTNKDELDLIEIYSKKNQIESTDNLPKGCTICRLCLKLIYNNCCVFLSDETKNMTSLKVLLSQHFPEIDLHLNQDAAVCSSCQSALQLYNNFMKKIGDMERATGCFQIKDINDQAILNSVSRVILKDTVKSEIHDIDTNGPKQVKSEYDQVNIKIEEIDFKRTQENTILFQPNEFYIHSPTYNIKTEDNLQDEIEIKTEDNFQEETEILYNCKLCSYTTNLKSLLEDHFRNHENIPESSLYHCHICPYNTKRKGNLRQHLIVHQNSTPFKCEACNFQTKHKVDLKLHMLVHKDSSEVTMYRCEICLFQTKHKRSLKRHQLFHQHHSEVILYKCPNCDYRTKFKNSLTLHSVVHLDVSKAKGFLCEICGIQVKRIGGFKQHLKTHRPVSLYYCYICKYKTKREKNLEKHCKIHQDVPRIRVRR